MRISIVTVAYNSAKTIQKTITSVLEQSYNDIEYIIVDGGSTDMTLDIISHYEPLFDGRMKWKSEADKGIYDAMNKGISMATGDVVGFLNSDDYYTSSTVVERICDAFDSESTDAVYGDIHFIRRSNPDKIIRYYSSSKFSPVWLRFGFMPAHPSFYLRRKRYEQAGGYSTDYRIAADYEMMVRLFHKWHIRAKYIPVDCVTMCTGGVSTRNIHSKIVLLYEDVRACRENGVYTNIFMVSLKVLYKIFEYRRW